MPSRRFLAQASKEHSAGQRYVALACLAPLMLFVVPLAIVGMGAAVDGWLDLAPFPSPPANVVLGFLLAVPSWLFGLWSVERQFTIGRGTPVPVLATQVLVVDPPYTYCRNPMALGAIGMYSGVAIVARSIGALLVVALLAGLLLAYIKRWEEREMQARFGADYLAYKQRTPFLLPRFRNRTRTPGDPGRS